ncbi:Hypothetical predicted protein [Lecanosticta acicola]|uniref:Uncharacterized protein n=1 Tax=Lecanosticta acicola TaxID=111012 RepID=A0AAI9E7M3_9PEZI|nr:Hypothetical predicted protein [Lecanosticta acicola]
MDIPRTLSDARAAFWRAEFQDDDRNTLNAELAANVQRELRFPNFQSNEDDTDSIFEEDQQPDYPVERRQSYYRRSGPYPDPPERGYMQRSSAFSIDSTVEEVSIPEWYPRGDATVTYPSSDGEMESISGLSPWIIEERCPLLAQAFEPSRNGPRLHLEALDSVTAMPFLRYLHTGSYALDCAGGDLYEDVPTSLLLHCQLYRLGDIYDIPDLKQQANVNVTRQCEFGCCSADKPIDLCYAIRFLYKHLPEHSGLIETVICYCVSCFLRHDLANDFEFRRLAYSLRPFHQDLAKESMKREFEDGTAAAIIRMPFKAYIPETYASREDIDPKRLRDVVYHFHGCEDFEGGSKERKRPEMVSHGSRAGGLLLALRTKAQDTFGGLTRQVPEEEEGVPETSKMMAAASEEKSVEGEVSVHEDSSEDGQPVAIEEHPSDAEYEVVSAPTEHQLSVESDSETEGLVAIRPISPALPDSVSKGPERAMPIRQRESRRGLFVTNPGPNGSDSDSDSEWTVV